MISNLLGKITSKALWIVILILTALLTTSLILNRYQDVKMKDLIQSENTFRLINVGLNQAISDLSEEVKKRPNEVITVVRDMGIELCKGQSQIDGIINLPATQVKAKQLPLGSKEEQVNEKEYVDIDAPFDPNFIRLLQ